MGTVATISERIRPVLASLRQDFQELYGVRLVKLVLYGSYARGDAREWSDIDVLAVLKGPVNDWTETRRTEEAVAALCLRFDAVIHWTFLEEEEFLRGEGPLARNIRLEGIEV